MRNILLLLLCLAIPALALAQSAPPVNPGSDTGQGDLAREATEILVQKYTLDTEQSAAMYAIQSRKQRNLMEIGPYETSNPALYRSKLNSVQRGTQASIRRLLNTPAQEKLFQQTLAEQRRLRGEKRKELLQDGATPAEVDAALLDIYLE
ncbi:MAG: hypothetical protein EP344_14125 [Bacteroidetes bacterium]|nr:MAG: hypothetical protein EP344_14125 [Bacteroidota bacterium]